MAKISSKVPPMEALEGLKLLVNAYQENHRITQEQKTIRANIKAQKEVKIEEIRQKAQLIREYFKNTFDERRNNFDKMFDGLEEALKSSNNEALVIYSNMIIATAQNSPLSGVRNLLENYNNPDVKEIEIWVYKNNTKKRLNIISILNYEVYKDR